MPRASTNLASTVRLLEMQEARDAKEGRWAQEARERCGNFGRTFPINFAEKEKIGQIFLFGIRSRSRRLKTIIKAFIIKLDIGSDICLLKKQIKRKAGETQNLKLHCCSDEYDQVACWDQYLLEPTTARQPHLQHTGFLLLGVEIWLLLRPHTHTASLSLSWLGLRWSCDKTVSYARFWGDSRRL